MEEVEKAPKASDTHDKNLRLLVIFQYVYTGICGLGILSVILHYAMMSYWMTREELWSNPEAPMPFNTAEIFEILKWVYVAFGIIMVVVFMLNLASVVFMQQRRYRMYSVVVGALNCLWFPFGTLIGVFTIILLQKDGVKALYEPPSQL